MLTKSVTATDLIVTPEQGAAGEPSATQRQDDAFVERVRINFQNTQCNEYCLVTPALTGNGQQCFEGDCAAGNCTLVTTAGDGIDVMSYFKESLVDIVCILTLTL